MKIHEMFPYLRVKDAPAAIAFYQKVFDAKERYRLVEPTGRVGHCELDFGVADIYLSEEFPEAGLLSPASIGATGMCIHLHLDDADAAIQRAKEAGATVVRPAADHFYGERSGTVRDPFGHEWLLGHSIEKVSPEEMQRRYTALFST